MRLGSGTPHAWLTVGLLTVVGGLNYLDRLMVTTMRQSIVTAIPMTDRQFGLLTTSFLFVYAFCSPLVGFLADRVSRSRVIIGSLFVWSLVTCLTAYATTYEQLVTARALMGVSEACYLPAALALIVDYHRGPTRSLAVGVHLCGLMIGAALGGFGGVLADLQDWRLPFQLFGLVGIAYAMVLVFILRDPRGLQLVANESDTPPSRSGFGTTIVALLSKPAFIFALTSFCLISLANWAVTGWMPTYLAEQFGLTQGKAGLSATSYINMAALVGLLLGGAWADRWSLKNERGRVLVPVIGLFIAAPAILLAATTSVLPTALIGLTVYGLTRSFVDTNMMPILCLIVPERYTATAYGVLNFGACLVGGITIYIGGALRDADVNVRNVFQFGAGCVLACAVLLALIKPASIREPESEELGTVQPKANLD
jgi:MFS family permease